MGAIKQRARANELRERGAPFLSSAFALARVAPLIGAACAEVPDNSAPQSCSVAIVRVKRGRVTVRYCFPSGAVVYAKVYESEAEGRRLYATQCALWEAGFNSTSLFRVPEPLAFLEEEYANVVLMTEARGAQLSLRIAGDPWEAAAAAMRGAARWLLYFHASHLPGLEEES